MNALVARAYFTTHKHDNAHAWARPYALPAVRVQAGIETLVLHDISRDFTAKGYRALALVLRRPTTLKNLWFEHPTPEDNHNERENDVDHTTVDATGGAFAAVLQHTPPSTAAHNHVTIIISQDCMCKAAADQVVKDGGGSVDVAQQRWRRPEEDTGEDMVWWHAGDPTGEKEGEDPYE